MLGVAMKNKDSTVLNAVKQIVKDSESEHEKSIKSIETHVGTVCMFEWWRE